MGDIDSAIGEQCRSQRGLVTLAQLHRVGVTRRGVQTRVERGELVPVNTKVFRHPVVDPTWEQDILGAVLAAGPGALVARRSAARLWGLSGARSSRVEVVVPRWTRRRLHTGQLIESTDLRRRDVAEVDGIPVTAVPRTLIDCAIKVGPARLAQMADDAVRRKLTTYEELLDRFVRLARRGRPGVVLTRSLLEARLGVELGANDFEKMVLDIVTRHRLPTPVCQHPVILEGEKFFLDLAWPNAKRFVECDGWDAHGSPQALTSDLRRQNLLVLAGWVPLRFSWQTVRHHSGLVARQIAAALAQPA